MYVAVVVAGWGTSFLSPDCLRTLDALQLAVALERNEQGAIDGFVLADQALSEVAIAERLPAILLA